MKNRLLSIFVIFGGTLLMTSSCSTISKITTSREINKELRSSTIFSNQLTGFVLYDPTTNEYLKNYNGNIHFTPASNTKILTTAATLEVLGDSIPCFSYQLDGDTLVIEPFGDPTFLHSDFKSQPALDLLNHPNIRVILPNYPINAFGPGWAWDDYEFSFQTERSEMPIYGNVVNVSLVDTLDVSPPFFKEYVTGYSTRPDQVIKSRDEKHNFFSVMVEEDTLTERKTKRIPFGYSQGLLIALLKDSIKSNITISNQDRFLKGEIAYNNPTLYTVALMMQRSDNFLAEQLLLVSANKSGYKSTLDFRRSLINKWSLPASTSWVDGSGLSRYNLIAPTTLVKILDHLYSTYDWNTIQTIFPTGGVSGTIKNWYSGDPPYVFAKTGTLSNNHSLSGYIKTNSGRTLIFSFMNNNYTCSSTEVKLEMQSILESIRDAY